VWAFVKTDHSLNSASKANFVKRTSEQQSP